MVKPNVLSGWSKRTTPAFLSALLVGGTTPKQTENPNKPGDLTSFTREELALVIDEGRRQLDAQAGRFGDVQARAQTLLTVSLVLLGFTTGVFGQLDEAHGLQHAFAAGVWAMSVTLVLTGLLLAAAVISVRAVFVTIDTTQITTFDQPLDLSLAEDYATAVQRGEETVADRLTAFQLATRYVVWGALLTAATFLLATM
jgi:hypothetical protein